jgi:hypothetical protein
MILAPRSFASIMWLATRGWASVVLDPITRKHPVCALNSGTELVIAPLPNAAARPATVGACQRRAQWSTLFVLTTTRANFCSR